MATAEQYAQNAPVVTDGSASIERSSARMYSALEELDRRQKVEAALKNMALQQMMGRAAARPQPAQRPGLFGDNDPSFLTGTGFPAYDQVVLGPDGGHPGPALAPGAPDAGGGQFIPATPEEQQAHAAGQLPETQASWAQDPMTAVRSGQRPVLRMSGAQLAPQEQAGGFQRPVPFPEDAPAPAAPPAFMPPAAPAMGMQRASPRPEGDLPLNINSPEELAIFQQTLPQLRQRYADDERATISMAGLEEKQAANRQGNIIKALQIRSNSELQAAKTALANARAKKISSVDDVQTRIKLLGVMKGAMTGLGMTVQGYANNGAFQAPYGSPERMAAEAAAASLTQAEQQYQGALAEVQPFLQPGTRFVNKPNGATPDRPATVLKRQAAAAPKIPEHVNADPGMTEEDLEAGGYSKAEARAIIQKRDQKGGRR